MSDFARLQELARAAGVQVAPPSNTAVPAVMPLEAAVGATLTCTMGEWTGEPTEYAYGWTSNGAPVGDATGSYTTVAGDAGHGIGCTVRATNAAGSTDAPMSNVVVIAATAARAAPAHAAPAPDAHSDARRK